MWGAAGGRALLGWEAADTCLGPTWPGLDRLSPLVGQVLHEPTAHHLDHSIALGPSQCRPCLPTPWEAGCEGSRSPDGDSGKACGPLPAPGSPTNRSPSRVPPGLSIVQSHATCWGHVGSMRGPVFTCSCPVPTPSHLATTPGHTGEGAPAPGHSEDLNSWERSLLCWDRRAPGDREAGSAGPRPLTGWGASGFTVSRLVFISRRLLLLIFEAIMAVMRPGTL